MEMFFKRTPMSEDAAFDDKEVCILNLLPFHIGLGVVMACVSAEKTATIKDMADMPTSKHSNLSMTINAM
eukprot:8900719-Ditylum_brightwellii.AAC.1